MPKYAAAITTPITAIETIAPTRSLIAKPPSVVPPSATRIATPAMTGRMTAARSRPRLTAMRRPSRRPSCRRSSTEARMSWAVLAIVVTSATPTAIQSTGSRRQPSAPSVKTITWNRVKKNGVRVSPSA